MWFDLLVGVPWPSDTPNSMFRPWLKRWVLV